MMKRIHDLSSKFSQTTDSRTGTDLAKGDAQVRRLDARKLRDEPPPTRAQGLVDQTVALSVWTGDSPVSKIPVSARSGGSGSTMGSMGKFALQTPCSDPVGELLVALSEVSDMSLVSRAIGDAERFIGKNQKKLLAAEKDRLEQAMSLAWTTCTYGIMDALRDASDRDSLTRAISDGNEFLAEHENRLSSVLKMEFLGAIDDASTRLEALVE